MPDQLFTSIVTIATAIIGVAILAVLVSKNANTAGVISSAGNALAQNLAVAISPVTGGGVGSFGTNILGSGNTLSLY